MLHVLLAVGTPPASGGHGHSNPIFGVIFGIFFAAIGLLHAVRPSTAFRMNRWQYKNKEAWEPSAGGLMMARIFGCVAVVIGIAIIVFSATR